MDNKKRFRQQAFLLRPPLRIAFFQSYKPLKAYYSTSQHSLIHPHVYTLHTRLIRNVIPWIPIGSNLVFKILTDDMSTCRPGIKLQALWLVDNPLYLLSPQLTISFYWTTNGQLGNNSPDAYLSCCPHKYQMCVCVLYSISVSSYCKRLLSACRFHWTF